MAYQVVPYVSLSRLFMLLQYSQYSVELTSNFPMSFTLPASFKSVLIVMTCMCPVLMWLNFWTL